MRVTRLLWTLLALSGCNAPDYTPVRDWAATASLAVDHPRIAGSPLAGSPVAPPPGAEPAQPQPRRDDSILAMQEALATYLQAVATLASDGVLPYRESPFVDLAARVTPASPSGGQAIAALGLLLRHANRTNAQAPMLRDNIRAADAPVQALISALLDAVARQAGEETQARQDAAAFYAGIEARSDDAAARQALREWAGRRDGAFAAQAAARAQYGEILTRVAAGHALLKGRAGRVTQEDVVQEVRIAEDQLRRAALALRRGGAG
ncbi:hypothetical protein EJV46_10380 [Roseococcus sp. SYP-B2431]|uniref:hypothetical protein n=1 Tax=Roseococcus sp. SYP-B2431 TaxID=2496640 RepID=UPI00103FF5F7|nr:hypothetical protein [Roseococcus sp. SYP-B2431]TCH98950.1 hypothetical protein EJV46_10380 [Roseococcus sp. SYP-B2431]